jgi:hypothetical protein
LNKLGKEYENTEYGKYLIILAKEDDKKWYLLINKIYLEKS